MGALLWHVSMSLDGFITGPGDSMEWVMGREAGSQSAMAEDFMKSIGALLAGRRWYDVATSRFQGVDVTADERGSHFRRNHRYPGTHPLTRARFFALSCRRPETHVVYALACGGAPEWGGPLR
jgi:hypothetical protein